jgi:hypothetical protein
MDPATAGTVRGKCEGWGRSQTQHGVARVGFEPARRIENAQVIENKKRQKR